MCNNSVFFFRYYLLKGEPVTVSTDMFFLDLGYISEARMVSLFKARLQGGRVTLALAHWKICHVFTRLKTGFAGDKMVWKFI